MRQVKIMALKTCPLLKSLSVTLRHNLDTQVDTPLFIRKHTITTRIEKGGRDPQAWITITLLIGDNSLELLLPMANKPQDLPSCGWVAPQINI